MAFRGEAVNVTSTGATTIVVTTQCSISAISQAASAVVTLTLVSIVNPFSIGTQILFSNVVGMTQINALVGTITALGGSSGAWTITVNINSIAFTAYSSGGTAALNIQAGDIILAAVQIGGSPNTFTFPSGFGPISGCTQKGSSGQNLWINLKVATGSEPASYTLTSSSSFPMAADLRVYSGRNPSFPVTAAVTTINDAATVTPFTLAVTGVTAAANDDVVMFVGFANANTASGNVFHLSLPSGFANRIDPVPFPGIAFGNFIASSDYTNNPGGATGTLAPILTTNLNGDFNFGAYVISLAVPGALATPVARNIFIMP